MSEAEKNEFEKEVIVARASTSSSVIEAAKKEKAELEGKLTIAESKLAELERVDLIC